MVPGGCGVSGRSGAASFLNPGGPVFYRSREATAKDMVAVLRATNDVLSERGVRLPLPGQSTTSPDTRAEKGLAARCRS